jgi:hypothetical protein
MTERTQKDKPLLFISHKHENRAIADALRNFVEMNTAGTVEVFQSSSEEAAGPRAGFSLNQELKNALWHAGAFVLIYTHPSLDWSYCMFEYGVANNPRSPESRMILFRCCDAMPALFAGQVNVNARELVDIQKFTNQLLTAPDFFPDHGEPVTQHQPNGQRVAAAAADLYQKLQAVLPPLTPASHEEWPAYPFLRLQLDMKHVEAIKNAPPPDRLRSASHLIRTECLVTGSDKEAERLFNSPGFDRGMKFETLVKAWMEKEEKRDSRSQWVESLVRQVTEGARWQFPPLVWELMQGINGGTWYAPIVTRVRRVPNQHMEFDIYFFKFEVDEENRRAKLGIPDPGGRGQAN